MTHGELYERNVLFKQTRRSKTESNSNSRNRQVSVEFDDEGSEDGADENEAEAKAATNVDISAILTGHTKIQILKKLFKVHTYSSLSNNCAAIPY